MKKVSGRRASARGTSLMLRYLEKPVPVGLMWPMITFSNDVFIAGGFVDFLADGDVGDEVAEDHFALHSIKPQGEKKMRLEAASSTGVAQGERFCCHGICMRHNRTPHHREVAHNLLLK